MIRESMVRQDNHMLRAILAEGTADERLTLLEKWQQDLNKWDIFPVELVLPCLHDADARVRVATIKILSSLAEFDEYEGRGMFAQWRMICDPENPMRRALIEGILQARFNIRDDDIEELVPLLRHMNSDVRNAVMQLFLGVPSFFNEGRCIEIANFSKEENLDIQETINELLESLGQGHLVGNEQG